MGHIKDRIEAAYASIKAAEEELVICRKECLHPVHRKTLYSWRVGCISPALVCEECDAFIKYLDEPVETMVKVTSGKLV